MGHSDYAAHHGHLSGLGMGFIFGAVIGVAIGMLYAPRTGAETRAMISDKAGEVKDKVGEAVDMVKQKASALRGRAEQAD